MILSTDEITICYLFLLFIKKSLTLLDFSGNILNWYYVSFFSLETCSLNIIVRGEARGLQDQKSM